MDSIRNFVYGSFESTYVPDDCDIYNKVGLFPDYCISWVNRNLIQKLEKIPLLGSPIALFLGTILKIIGICVSTLLCIFPCFFISPGSFFSFILELSLNKAEAQDLNRADVQNLLIYNQRALPFLEEADGIKLAKELSRKEPNKQFVIYRVPTRIEADMAMETVQRLITEKLHIHADEINYNQFSLVWLSNQDHLTNSALKSVQRDFMNGGMNMVFHAGKFKQVLDHNDLKDQLEPDKENSRYFTHLI